MKIAIGADHAGFRLKEKIKDFLKNNGYEIRDFGTRSEEPVDYPFFIRPVAVSVAKGESDRGIVLGGSGNGEAMVANRIKGIRCALCWNRESALLARKHNDANMISLGARMISEADALKIVEIWLETPFDGGRHLPRIRQIDELSSKGKNTDLAGSEALIKAPDISKRDSFDVLISFGYIIYSEGKNQLELKVDPGLKHPTIIHFPSPDTWEKDIPAWAKDRRGLILERLKEKCCHLDYIIKEY